MFKDYFSELFSSAFLLAITIMDGLAYILGLIDSRILFNQIWYLIIFLLAFLWRNYEIYKEHKVQLLEIKNSHPKLTIEFSKPKKIAQSSYIYQGKNISLNAVNNEKIAFIKSTKDNKKYHGDSISEVITPFFKQQLIPLEERKRIDKDYEESLTRYIKEKLIFQYNLIKIEPVISNLGYKHSTKNKVIIKIPPELRIPNDEELIYILEPSLYPEPPEKPSYFSHNLSLDFNLDGSYIHRLNIQGINNGYPIDKGPIYKDSSVCYEIDSLLPQDILDDLDPFYVFITNNNNSSLSILQIEMYSAELSKPIIKRIDIEIQLTDIPSIN